MRKQVAIFIMILTAALSSTSIANTMHLIRWEIQTTSDSISGHSLYIYDNDSMFRIEVSTLQTANNSIFDCLLSRDGQGWTITPSINDSAVIQPWSGQFSELGKAEYSACITLLEILQTSDHRRSSLVTLQDPLFYKDSITSKPAELLNRMRIRGAGKGAAQEIWSVDKSGEHNTIVTISSNRTPAVIKLFTMDSYEFTVNEDMLYVPIWSLDDLINNN